MQLHILYLQEIKKKLLLQLLLHLSNFLQSRNISSYLKNTRNSEQHM
jgi:hypothetical protein